MSDDQPIALRHLASCVTYEGPNIFGAVNGAGPTTKIRVWCATEDFSDSALVFEPALASCEACLAERKRVMGE